MTSAVGRAGTAACCDDPRDAAWGRLPGAAPPLPTWVPAAVAAVVALVLALVVVLVVRPPGPLDDPNPARQRDGLLLHGPALPPEAAGVRFGGRRVVVLFERTEPAGPAFQAWKALVADDGVELVVRVGPAGDALARLVGMPTPVDGKRPVGYAVIDAARTVRYATLDPAYEKNADRRPRCRPGRPRGALLRRGRRGHGRAWPDLVRRLVLVAPAAFADTAQARARIGGRSWIARKAMDGSPVAGVACGTMCLFRRPLTSLAPRIAATVSPDITPDVARDALRYVWPAYRDALTSLLADSPLSAWLADPPLPTTVVIAEDDQTVPADGLSALLGPRVDVVRIPGTHGLPLERPAEVTQAILRHGNTPASSALS